MSRKPTSSFLDEAIGLLVKHFGVDRIRAALPKSPDSASETIGVQLRRRPGKSPQKVQPNITSKLEQIQRTDEEKYNLLNSFYIKLKDAKVLPDSQDIRQFAQDIGLKEISGKSRKDMIPKLVKFLAEQPTEKLRNNISKAASVSEQQRQEGFSILTDKLLGEK